MALTNNQLFVLELLDLSGKVECKTKLQKLIFLSEYDSIQESIEAFNYNFFRYVLGPYSKGVTNDINNLQEQSVITVEDGKFILTEQGEGILRILREKIELSPISEIIKNHAKELSSLTARNIMDKVYEKEVMINNKSIKIKDINLCVDIIRNNNFGHSKKIFEIDETFIDTIEFLSDKNAFESLQCAIEDLKEGRIEKGIELR